MADGDVLAVVAGHQTFVTPPTAAQVLHLTGGHQSFAVPPTDTTPVLKMVAGHQAFAEYPVLYRDAIMADSSIIAGYWRLGEPSGTTANDELGPADASLVNTPTLGVGGLLVGDANTAMTFTRASTEYAFADSVMPAGTSAGAGVEGLARFATLTAATRYPLARWWLNSPAAECQFYFDVANGCLRYTYQDNVGAKTVNSDAWSPATATTYHLAVAHDYVAEQVRFFVNGSLHSLEDVSANGPPVVHNASGFCTIARAGSDYFDGMLDEIVVYKGHLSAARVAAHYAAAT